MEQNLSYNLYLPKDQKNAGSSEIETYIRQLIQIFNIQSKSKLRRPLCFKFSDKMSLN